MQKKYHPSCLQKSQRINRAWHAEGLGTVIKTKKQKNPPEWGSGIALATLEIISGAGGGREGSRRGVRPQPDGSQLCAPLPPTRTWAAGRRPDRGAQLRSAFESRRRRVLGPSAHVNHGAAHGSPCRNQLSSQWHLSRQAPLASVVAVKPIRSFLWESGGR